MEFVLLIREGEFYPSQFYMAGFEAIHVAALTLCDYKCCAVYPQVLLSSVATFVGNTFSAGICPWRRNMSAPWRTSVFLIEKNTFTREISGT